MQGNADGEIKLDSITKRFPGIVANDNITLAIKPGKVHCILGENGAGKSTLIGILAGMQQPDGGRVIIDGSQTRIGSPKVASNLGIGVVHQHSTLVPSFTVIENLMLGERGFRLKKEQAIERLDELSDILGTRIDPEVPTDDLGLGQQQLVEIVKAMWQGSRLLILDEPTSMLPPQAVEHLFRSVERIRSQGLSIIFITHKIHEAYALGDTVTILRRGRVVERISGAQLAELGESQSEKKILAGMFGETPTASEPNASDEHGSSILPRHKEAGTHKELNEELQIDRISTLPVEGVKPVTDISLSVKGGQIQGIAGIDGHGQVALAQAIAGQRKIKSGSLYFNGEDVSDLGVRERQSRGIRYVTDDRLHEGTIGDMDIAMNLVIKKVGEQPFWTKGRINRKSIDEYASRIVHEYDIRTPSIKTRISTLSGGNVQKVLLARELSNGAKCLVINKPTYGLDLRTVDRVRNLIRNFAESGGAVLLMSSDIDELIELCPTISVMSEGKITGTVENYGKNVAEKIGKLMIGEIHDVKAQQTEDAK